MRFNVAAAFEQFCLNLRFPESDLNVIRTRYHAITKRINLDYWNLSSSDLHSLYVGSYGRDTEIFTSDIDILVQLPQNIFDIFNAYSSNGQSALLQDVKHVIEKTFSTTNLKSDGQIISLPFSDGIDFEVLPAFQNDDGTYVFANANDGGSWHVTDPKNEILAIADMNRICNSNLKRLSRMARAWKNANNVCISGILLDILSYNFLAKWEHRTKSYLYYDWMSRDFFKYVSEQNPEQIKWQVMGSGRYIYWFGNFQNKAKSAYINALNAIDYQEENPSLALYAWRNIYGSKF